MRSNDEIFGQKADELFGEIMQNKYAEMIEWLFGQVQHFHDCAIQEGITFPAFCPNNLELRIRSGEVQCFFSFYPDPDPDLSIEDNEPHLAFCIQDTASSNSFKFEYYAQSNSNVLHYTDNSQPNKIPFNLSQSLDWWGYNDLRDCNINLIADANINLQDVYEYNFFWDSINEAHEDGIYPTVAKLAEYDLLFFSLRDSMFNSSASDQLLSCGCQYFLEHLKSNKLNPYSQIKSIKMVSEFNDLDSDRFARALLAVGVDLSRIFFELKQAIQQDQLYLQAQRYVEVIENSKLLEDILSIRLCESLEGSLEDHSLQIDLVEIEPEVPHGMSL